MGDRKLPRENENDSCVCVHVIVNFSLGGLHPDDKTSLDVFSGGGGFEVGARSLS
jgi:hypothetical protein